MSAPKDLPPAAAAAARRDLTTRLAEAKQEAARGISADVAEDLDEEALLAEAALGLAGRREARGDLVGAMTWEEIAGGATAHPEPSGADLPAPGHFALGTDEPEGSLPDPGVPARRARQDGHDDQ